MDQQSRRTVLAAATAGVTALAGCSGSALDPSNGPESGADGGSGTGGETPAEAAGEPIELETLDVEGSPGETLPVRQPDSVTLVDFFATWCKPCEEQMPDLRTVAAENPDVHMVSITTEREAEAVAEFWREHEATWPVALDTEALAIERYGVQGFPTMVIIAPDGEISWRHTGISDAATIGSKLEAARQ